MSERQHAMSELKRWTDDDAPEAIERLLRAAEAEQPSAASLAATLTSLGVVAGATGVASVASGAAASGTGSAAGLSGASALAGAAVQNKLSVWAIAASLAKWIALGTTVGGAAVAVYATTDTAPAPAPAQATVAQRASAGPAAPAREGAVPNPVAAPTPGTAASAVGDRVSSGGSNVASPRAARPVAPKRREGGPPEEVPEAVRAVPVETLAAEIAGIDRARSLLAAGRYSAVVAALNDFDREFPRHHFAPEVLYLRMQAASGAGQTEQARRLARRLLAAYPTSPQSEKARRLLEPKD